jgi:hypothetical protein
VAVDVRFLGQALHCHISRAELERLKSGRALDLSFPLPRHHAFRLNVRPSPLAADRGGWELASDPTGIWLTIPRAEVEQLGQTTEFAERLVRDFALEEGGQVQVILELEPEPQAEERSVLEITPQAQ